MKPSEQDAKTTQGIRDAVRLGLDKIGTPHGIAEIFCDMDAHRQAEFFDQVGSIMCAWGGAKRLTQLHEVGRRVLNHGTYEGQRVLLELADVLGDPAELATATPGDDDE